MVQTAGSNRSEQLFNAIYAAHYQRIYAYFFGRTQDEELALDLLQETFTRAWRHIATLTEMEESQHLYWLFSVAKNLFTDTLRRTTRWQAIAGDMVSLAKESAKRPADPMTAQTQLIVLDEAIARLPEQHRIVLSMSVLGGMNSTQIGQALGIAAGTVRYQLVVARRQLLDDLEQD